MDVLEAEQMIARFALWYSAAELVGGIEICSVMDDDLLTLDIDSDLEIINFTLLQTEEAVDCVVGNRQLQTLQGLLFGVDADRSKAFVKPNLVWETHVITRRIYMFPILSDQDGIDAVDIPSEQSGHTSASSRSAWVIGGGAFSAFRCASYPANVASS